MANNPALVIGLGGTGKDVVRQIMGKFTERDKNPNGDSLIRYLVIDADPDLSMFTAEKPVFLNPSISATEFTQYVASKDSTFQFINRWLPKDKVREIGCPQNGAGQIRSLGRMIFYHNLSNKTRIRMEIDKIIESLIGEARASEKLNLPSGANPTIDVYLVYSIAGGTGAGMFMDLALLLKTTGKQVDINIKHFALLPEIFLGTGATINLSHRNRIKANGYGALVDIELMNTATSTKSGLQWPLEDENEVKYLCPTVNDNGVSSEIRINQQEHELWKYLCVVGLRPNTDQYQAITQVAEAIFLNFEETQLGDAIRSLTSNNNLNEPIDSPVLLQTQNGDKIIYKRQLQKCYSAMGLSFIRFDRDILKKKAAQYLGKIVIKEYLQRDLKISQILLETEIAKFFSTKILIYSAVELADGKDQKHDDLIKGLIFNLNDGLIGERLQQLDDEVNSIESLKKAAASLGSPRAEHFSKNKDKAYALLKIAFVEKVQRLFDAYGPEDIKKILFNLSEALDKYIKNVNESVAGFNTKANANRPNLGRYFDALSIPFYSSIPGIVFEQIKEQFTAYVTNKFCAALYECVAVELEQFKNDYFKQTANRKRFLDIISEYQECLVNIEVEDIETGSNYEIQIGNSSANKITHSKIWDEQRIREEIWKCISSRPPLSGKTFPQDISNSTFKATNLKEYYEKFMIEMCGMLTENQTKTINFGSIISGLFPLSQRPAGFSYDAISANLKNKIFELSARHLDNFAKDVTINDYFWGSDEKFRNDVIDVLKNESKLLLEQSPNVAVNLKLQLATTNVFLGLKRGTKHSEKIEALFSKQMDLGPSELLQVVDSRDDMIFIYRDLTKIPICYYNKLDDLRNSYKDIADVELYHFDYRYFKSLIGNIGFVGNDEGSFIKNTIANVLYSIILKVMTYDPGSESYMFIWGGGRTSSLGNDLNTIIESLKSESRKDVREALPKFLNKKFCQIIDDDSEDQLIRVKGVKFVNALRLMRLNLRGQLLKVYKDENFHLYPLYILVDEAISESVNLVNYQEALQKEEFQDLEKMWNDICAHGQKEQIEKFVKVLEGKDWYTYPNPILPIPVIGEK